MGPLRPLFRASFLILVMLVPAVAWRAPSAGADDAVSDSSEAPRYRLDPVVVTAERMPLRLRRVPLDISVIGRDRLDLMRPLSLSDALREVPSVDVQRSGDVGALTDVRIRGADPRHTLVLFDGIPLNGPWLGTFDFADLMDPGIDHVEVLGGPASSLYGSGAVGGVIQLLSPAGTVPSQSRPLGARVRGFAEYGEDATLRQGAQWSGAVGQARAGAAVAHLTANGAQPRDAYRGFNGTFYVDAPLGGAGGFHMSALGTDGRKELPFDFIFDPTDLTLSPFGSSKEIRDPNNDERDRLLAGRATWDKRLSHLASIEGEVSGLTGRIKNDNRPNGGASTDFQNTEMKNRRGVGSLRARLSADPALAIVLGADYRSDRVDRHDRASFGGFPSVSDVERGIHARSLYGQAHGEGFGRILVDAGIRLDDHSIYGAYGVPRLALGVDVRELGLTIRGGYGRAFTAPTLTDLYYPGYGNEALRPERSTTWETGANGRWLDDRLTVRGTYHRTRFRDLIQSNAFFVADNVGEARIEGEEYAVQFAPHPRLRIGGSAAHLIAKNLNTGVPLAKRPAWRFGAWGDGSPLEGLTLTAAWRWVDATRDPFDFIDASGRALRGDTPGYASLDLGAIASLRRWAPLEWNLKLTNALDRAYSEVKGFPARRRAIIAGITFTRG